MNEAPRASRRAVTAGAGWAITIAVAVLAASHWLDAPTVQYLVTWALATIAAAIVAWRLRGSQRGWALACAAFLSVGLILGGRSQRELARVRGSWNEWQATRARAGLDALNAALTDAERQLASAAAAALRAPVDREAAFGQLQSLVKGHDETGIVLYRGDSAYAWAGRSRVVTDTLKDPTSVSASDFYLTLYSTAESNGDRAVATMLLSAAPPADRLSRPLSQRIARAAGLDDFTFSAPGTFNGRAPVLHFAFGGRAILDARAAAVESGEVIQKLHERLRVDVGVLLGAALACFIIAAWRETRGVLASW